MTLSFPTRRSSDLWACRRPAGEPEERPQQSAEVAARETGDEPQPAMQAAGGDAAEEGADVAAESEPGAVAHEQPAERGAQHLAPRQPPGRIETAGEAGRSEEHTSELQSLMRISYAVFCLTKKKKYTA